MNRTAHKCEHCKKAMPGARIGQKYCTLKCRQAAYRQRQPRPKRARPAVERELTVATCQHCGGSFFAATARARFCSTSCRSLYHRAMRAAIPDALAAAYGLPADKAVDLLDTLPLARVKARLTDCGWHYRHDQRAWVQQLETYTQQTIRKTTLQKQAHNVRL